MKKTMFYILGIIFILVFLVVFNIGNFSFEQRTPSTPVNSGWQYRAGDSPVDKNGKLLWLYDNDNTAWKYFSIPGQPNINNNNGYVWARVKLPKHNYRDPSIYFYTYNQDFEVFIDEKKIYGFGNMNNKKVQESFWHTIELPYNFAGKTVYIRMHSVHKTTLGEIRNFELCSRADKILSIIKGDFFNFTIALFFVIIGFASLLFSLVNLKGEKLFIDFSLSYICCGIWLVSEGKIKQIFIYAPEFWEYTKIISQFLIPIILGLFVNRLLNKKFSKIFNSIVAFYISLLVVSLLCDFFNIMPLSDTFPVYSVSIVFSMVIIVILIVKNYFQWELEVKIFALGFGILCFLGIYDVLSWNFNYNNTNSYLTEWGIIAFLLSLCVVANVHYVKTNENSIRYQKQLIESQQQLKFFANISHELRTPLNIILSSIQLLNVFIPDGSIKINGKEPSNYFDVMKLNCLRLLKLVNNLIDINKIEAGYLKADFQNRDIVSVVENITQSTANYMKSKGISIIFDTDVEEKIMACDIEKIERIMLNLLSNAVKFSGNGGEICVEIHDADTEVVITVSDIGIGIMPDKLDDIFKRFVQVDKSFTRNHEGSGIGLSLVKELVVMHGGNIAVESEYGRGSKFIVTLPTKRAQNNPLNENVKIMKFVDMHDEQISIEFSDI
jgi:signal transduction histidine kinase